MDLDLLLIILFALASAAGIQAASATAWSTKRDIRFAVGGRTNVLLLVYGFFCQAIPLVPYGYKQASFS